MALTSAAWEAASPSTRGSGWAPSGPASRPGSAELPRAARRALGRHRRRAVMGHFDPAVVQLPQAAERVAAGSLPGSRVWELRLGSAQGARRAKAGRRARAGGRAVGAHAMGRMPARHSAAAS
eukprot:scaffold9509_cov47-Phaeocystis_antarctica.AAC.2